MPIENSNNPAFPAPAATPLVSEALAAVNEPGNGDRADVSVQQELGALRSELDRMKESLGEIASASARISQDGIEAMRSELERKIRERPIGAVLIAACAGYVLGRRL